MRRLGWYAVSALVAALILGGVLLLAANLYVQSTTVQQRIRLALTSTLKMPVTIRKTTVTPWEGLRIDGIAAAPAPPPGVAAAPDFLKADSFRVRFALWPLLQRRLVVTLVWLDRPQLAWAQNAEGRWQFPPGQDTTVHHPKKTPRPPDPLPAASPAPTATETAAPPVAPSPPVIAEVPPPPSPTPPKPAAERRPGGFTIALDRFRLRHGTLDFLSAKRHPIGQFEEVNLDGQLSEDQHVSGTLWFNKARLSRAGLMLTDVRSGFTFDRADGLTLSGVTARFAGGSVTANYRMRTGEPGSPFTGDFHVERVDLAQLLQQMGSRVALVEGSLQGQVNASGESDRAESRRATGKFEFINARVKDMPIFQMIGSATRIDDLAHLQFKTAQLDCQLDGTVLAINPLLLVSNDLKITAHGHYQTDEDHLDVHARLVIDEAVSRQLPEFIGEQFKPCGDEEAAGSKFVDFNVTGSVNNMKSDLYNKLVGDPMKGFFNTILSPSKSKSSKEKSSKKSHAETPSPTPTPPVADAPPPPTP